MAWRMFSYLAYVENGTSKNVGKSHFTEFWSSNDHFINSMLKNPCWVSSNSISWIRYLDTCPKNDVISFFRKCFCALGLGLRTEVRIRISGNTFSVKRPSGKWVHDFIARPLWRGPFFCGPFWRCPFCSGPFWRDFHGN